MIPIMIANPLLSSIPLITASQSHCSYSTAITTTLIAGVILFSALVEANPHNESLSILVLEIVKSAGATALWLWLVLDAFFFPQRYNNADSRMRRITLSLVSVLILL
jgi:hypothetical protein